WAAMFRAVPAVSETRAKGAWWLATASWAPESLPIPNSATRAFASMGRPAARSRVTTVASYGATQPSRKAEPAAVGAAWVTMTSDRTTGTPASGWWSYFPASTSAATARASSALMYTNASEAASRCAVTSSTAVMSPARSWFAISVAVSWVRDIILRPGLQGPCTVRLGVLVHQIAVGHC